MIDEIVANKGESLFVDQPILRFAWGCRREPFFDPFSRHFVPTPDFLRRQRPRHLLAVLEQQRRRAGQLVFAA